MSSERSFSWAIRCWLGAEKLWNLSVFSGNWWRHWSDGSEWEGSSRRNPRMRVESSLVPRPPPQLSSLAVRITSDDSCGGGLGTRLGAVPSSLSFGCSRAPLSPSWQQWHFTNVLKCGWSTVLEVAMSSTVRAFLRGHLSRSTLTRSTQIFSRSTHTIFNKVSDKLY